MSLRKAVSELDHIEGNVHAPIELVEYGDYQCPYCGQAYPIVKKLQHQVGEKLKFVFRNFPLSEIHAHSKIAAIAAEAAALQGKFWEMHDMLFENQKRLHSTALIEYAYALGLNIEQFEKDCSSTELAEKVEADFYSGMRSGVNATPTFFINGEKYVGSWAGDDLLTFLKDNFSEI